MSGEVCLNVKLSGGRQLSVSKDGSQLTARATWSNNQIESGKGFCHFCPHLSAAIIIEIQIW